MKRKIIIFTLVFVLLIALAITVAGCSSSLSSVNGKYYMYKNGQKVEDSFVELKIGNKWYDGEYSGTYKLNGNYIILFIEGEEYISGTVKDGVLDLDVMCYYKDGAYGSTNNSNTGNNSDNTGNGNTGNGDTPNTPAVPDEKAKIMSIVNGTVDGMTCNMEVNSSVSSVDLSGAITVSEDSSWQLYADVLGQTNIPTKYAANLSNGDNVYYIVVNSADGTVNRTYTLHIWKNFEVEILFKVDGKTVKTLTKQTHTYIPQSEFSAAEKEGYTFIEWSNYAGKDYYISGYAGETYFLDYQIIFEAKFSANNYVITLDGNGGECNEKSKTVTYDQPFTLPVLSRKGYTFRGWVYDYWNRLTLEDGESVADYNYDYDITATASWTVNSYLLTLSQEENNGTISGGGQKDYGSMVTITAKANNGYNFDGWYNNGKKVSSESTYTFTMPAENKTYTAKWEVDKELENFEFTSSNNGITITGLKNKNVTDVTIPDGVTTIGDHAFYMCDSLTTITIPDGVTTIGDYAFYWCINLTSITIPYSVTTIGSSAFRNCDNLTIYCEAVSEPSGWDSYWNYNNRPVVWAVRLLFDKDCVYRITNNRATFAQYIGSATVVSVPSSITIDGVSYSVTSIGNYAFSGRSSLTTITIPGSVTSIGSDAFCMCGSLTSIEVDENNQNYKSIDGNLYSKYSTTLIQYAIGKTETSSTIPDGVTTIGDNAFYMCDSLTTITIPDSVTSIGDDAFSECSNLTSVTFGENSQLTTIGKNAFYDCDNLTAITIPDSVKTIEYEAFYSCDNLESVTFGENSLLTTIGDYTFAYCTSLTTITIPDSVTSIGSSAFGGCSGLTSITVPFVGAKAGVTSSDTYQYPFGYIFGTSSYTGGTAVEQYYYGSSTSLRSTNTYYIPSSLRSVTVTGGNILYGAFYDCDSLTAITIPNSVTTIGASAFYDCDKLTAITIPNSATTIGAWAFYSCSNLTRITFGGNSQLTAIENWAFAYCTSLTSIIIPDSVTTIGNYAFRNCYSLTIYCEAKSKPSGWSSSWNESNRPVVWGYKEE